MDNNNTILKIIVSIFKLYFKFVIYLLFVVVSSPWLSNLKWECDMTGMGK